MKTALVLGKFYPPHNGHISVIEKACKWADMTIVVVGSKPSEKLSAKLRVEWLQQLVPPNTMVVDIPDDNPPAMPMHDPLYFKIWKKNLQTHLPFVPNKIFGSDLYIINLAKEMNIEWTLVDQGRSKIPVSGTKIRENISQFAEFIPEVVMRYLNDHHIEKIS